MGIFWFVVIIVVAGILAEYVLDWPFRIFLC